MLQTQSPEERLDALRARMREVRERAAALEAELRARYAPGYSGLSAAWEYTVPRGKREALKAAHDRAYAAELAVCDYINSISPRSWSSGVPMRYVTDELPFLDVITDGALSTVPPVPYGGSISQVRTFAQALPKVHAHGLR